MNKDKPFLSELLDLVLLKLFKEKSCFEEQIKNFTNKNLQIQQENRHLIIVENSHDILKREISKAIYENVDVIYINKYNLSSLISKIEKYGF
jgi:thymidylate kinase